MNVHALQTNFTGGEISPTVYGRTDLARYANAVKTAENVRIMVQGGVTSRPGTVKQDNPSSDGTPERIIPFIASTTDAYVLAFGTYTSGDLPRSYFDVYKDGNLLVTKTIPTGPGLDIAGMRYTQANDVMVLASQSFAPLSIKRLSDTNWQVGAYQFTAQPQSEQGRTPSASYTLSGTTGSVTITASGAVFVASDVGRQLKAGTGLADVTTIGGGGTTATVTTVSDFDAASYATGELTLLDSPYTSIALAGSKNVGDSVTITAGADAFFSGDVGKKIYVNGGVIRLSGYTSSTQMAGIVFATLDSLDTAYPGGWSIQENTWKSGNYPACCAYHEGRLVFAGSQLQPQTLWFSALNAFGDFTLGTNPDDAMEFQANSDRRDQVRHLVSSRALLVLTQSTEYAVFAPNNGPLTPETTVIKPQSTYGASDCLPEVVGTECLFMQRSGQRLRAAGYSYEVDNYVAPDLTELHDRIFLSGAKELCYAQEPAQTVYVVLKDGTMASLTYSAQQAVTGFVRHTFPFTVLSACSVPEGQDDAVYLLVLDGSAYRLMRMDYGVLLDNAATGSGSALTSVTVPHLANKSVTLVLDGQAVGTITAGPGGAIAFPFAADEWQAGIAYTPKVELLPVELSLNGSIQGRVVSVSEITLRVVETEAITVNGTEIGFRQFGDNVLDQPVEPFTGDKVIGVSGAARNGKPVIIEQRRPLPFLLLTIKRKLTVND